MAGPEIVPEATAISVGSYDTALCIIPPREAWPTVDRLRVLYDKSYEKWPPHVNLVYPFVQPEALPRAAGTIGSTIARRGEADLPRVSLDTAGVFQHKHDNTIYISDNNKERNNQLAGLRKAILSSLGQDEGNYQMHMTIAQSEDIRSDIHKFLLSKVGLLPPVEWEVDQLYVLIRERLHVDGNPTSQLKIWGTINLSDGSLSRLQTPRASYEGKTKSTNYETAEKDQLQTRSPYYFEAETGLWMSHSPDESEEAAAPETLAVSSYNVLAEFEWPPSQERYPVILKNILSKRAESDVLVLQEVTDDFLSYLLRDELIREVYDFVSHGPPEQTDIEPLPSFLNIVVLSKFPFQWEWVSFLRKHKGSLVAKFPNIGSWEDGEFIPLVLAGIHLSHGLNDPAVAAKKVEIQRILNYLSNTYPINPWILVGDTNLSTSSYSIEEALNKKAISNQTEAYLSSIDDLFAARNLTDAWTFARFGLGEAADGENDEDIVKDIYDGEQGATYDPLANELAASIVGSGFNMRPQRYDRILVKGEGALTITKFNMFGFLKEVAANGSETSYASDHWGIRCTMRLGQGEDLGTTSSDLGELVVPVQLKKALEDLSDARVVKEVLSCLDVFPTKEDAQKRQVAFDALKHLIEDAFKNPLDAPSRRLAIVTVPVGSYALGVWTASSDIDCLCLGPFGTRTFFAVVVQRLRKTEGFKILRRVKAQTGTMLELEVQGVKMDLQYCPAASVAEQWPNLLRAPASNPIWTLSTQTLLKLKAIRDLDYLRRSIPDIVKFRIAYRFIKTWAKSRGVYSARFGYLGGIQISILLTRVLKLLARETGSGSASLPDIITTFFNHYASFDWKNKMAFDPFFHKSRLQYTRTTREPLAILGYFPPALNTSQAASLPSVRSIVEELRRANTLLSSPGTTWTSFFCGPDAAPSSVALGTGAVDFLNAYRSYVRIDAQFWGISATKGAQFIGWLESRCVMLLVDINRRLPDIHARIWPARFVAAEQAHEESEQGRDYQGHYLVGLDKLDPGMSREDLKVAFGSLKTVLRRFEELIRGDEKYFDAKNCWMSASVVNQAELGELKIDRREWGGYTPGEEESDDEEEEEGLLGEDGEERPEFLPLSRKHQKNQNSEIVVPKLAPGQKLRTASDVMNRLRWDPELDSSDYLVGYVDRFVGPMERDLDAWKLEKTDEEFIPQHRILWFKQKSTGKIMWERRTRKDEIFGSGAP